MNNYDSEENAMNMQEATRIILELRAKGWTDTEIVNFILYIESGDSKYKTDKD